jgi:WD40 repeat protein
MIYGISISEEESGIRNDNYDIDEEEDTKQQNISLAKRKDQLDLLNSKSRKSAYNNSNDENSRKKKEKEEEKERIRIEKEAKKKEKEAKKEEERMKKEILRTGPNAHLEAKFLLKTIKEEKHPPMKSLVAFNSLFQSLIVSTAFDKNIKFSNAKSGKEQRYCSGHSKTVMAIAASDMGFEGEEPVTVSGSRDGAVIIWNPADDYSGEMIQLPVEEIRCMSIYQGSGTFLLVGTKDSKVLLWDLENDEIIHEYFGHKGYIHCVSICTYVADPSIESDLDFMCVFSGGADRTVRQWDFLTGAKLRKFKHNRSIGSVAIANKGIRPLVAAGRADNIISIWDMLSGLKLQDLEGHLGPINQVLFWEGYEMLIISASSDNTLRVWDAVTGDCCTILVGHESDVVSVALLQGSKSTISSCGLDNCLRLWDLDNIINTYFRGADGDDGYRNDTQSYLPEITYVNEHEQLEEVKKERRETRRISKQKNRRESKRLKRNEELENILSDKFQPQQRRRATNIEGSMIMQLMSNLGINPSLELDNNSESEEEEEEEEEEEDIENADEKNEPDSPIIEGGNEDDDEAPIISKEVPKETPKEKDLKLASYEEDDDEDDDDNNKDKDDKEEKREASPVTPPPLARKKSLKESLFGPKSSSSVVPISDENEKETTPNPTSKSDAKQQEDVTQKEEGNNDKEESNKLEEPQVQEEPIHKPIPPSEIKKVVGGYKRKQSICSTTRVHNAIEK